MTGEMGEWGSFPGLPRWLGPENSLCDFMKRHWVLVEGWEGSGLAAMSTGGSALDIEAAQGTCCSIRRCFNVLA